jgi:hypothetical protein
VIVLFSAMAFARATQLETGTFVSSGAALHRKFTGILAMQTGHSCGLSCFVSHGDGGLNARNM